MNDLFSLQKDVCIFSMIVALTLSACYAAWTNLFHRKISKLGLDAFVALVFFSTTHAKKIQNDPKLIRKMGFIMLLMAAGGIHQVIITLAELLTQIK